MKITRILFLGVLLLAALSIVGCGGNSGAAAKDGDTVSVHYTGTLDDGSEFDSSRERGPLTFELGAGQMISGFEDAVRGMKVGEKKTVTIPPEEAYGLHRDDLIITLTKEQVPEGTAVGDRLTLQSSQIGPFNVVVIEVTESSVIVDANPPLAGENLTFEIEMVEIIPGTG